MMIQTFHIAQPPVWKHSEQKRGKRYFLADQCHKVSDFNAFFKKFFFQFCKVVFRNTPLKKFFFINRDFSLWGLPKWTFFPKFQLFLYNLLFENRYFIFENMYYTMINYLPAFLPWWSRCILKIFYSFLKRKKN